MRSQLKLFIWILVVAVVGTSIVAAFVFSEQLTTFIAKLGRNQPKVIEQQPKPRPISVNPIAASQDYGLEITATASTDASQKAITELSLLRGQEVQFDIHYYWDSAVSQGAIVTIDVDEAYLDNIHAVNDPGVYDKDVITWQLPGKINKSNFGHLRFKANLRKDIPEPAISRGTPGNIKELAFDTKVVLCPLGEQALCLDKVAHIAVASKGPVAHQLTATIETTVEGGGAVKPGKSVDYKFMLKNNSKKEMDVTGATTFPSLLTPTLRNQPSSGVIYFEGKQMVLDGLKIKPGKSVEFHVFAHVGPAAKGQPMYLEFTANDNNGASEARTGSLIKGNFFLVTISK